MSGGLTIKIERNDIKRDLARAIAKVQRPERLMRAIGVGLVGLTKEAFNNASLRPAPWKDKKDGTPATLKSREATLWRSIKVQSFSSNEVKIGSDRPYASIHQLGGKSRPMPARPYFPFVGNDLTKPAEKRTRDIIEAYMKM